MKSEVSGIDNLVRYQISAPGWWVKDIVHKESRYSNSLYLYYSCLKVIGQGEVVYALKAILRTCRKLIDSMMPDAVSRDLVTDCWRSCLRRVHSHCFTRVFSVGPAYMLFCHLMTLGSKAPYDPASIAEDLDSWVGPDNDRGPKRFDTPTVNDTLSKIFASWRGRANSNALSFSDYCNDFLRWGTSGGAKKSEYRGKTYRTKWGYALSRCTHHDRDALLDNIDLYAMAMAHDGPAQVALKEEANKTRQVITTPMPSYLRQGYLAYRYGRPPIPSPLAGRDYEYELETRRPSWWGCIDGQRFDHDVPADFVKQVIRMMGELDDETRMVAELELEHLDSLHVEWDGRKWKWEGGLLSGWRLTSIIGSLASCCAAEHVKRLSGLPLQYAVMGDDIAMFSHSHSLSPERLVAYYNDFGLHANLNKTTSGPVGEFLRKVHSVGGTWGYPASAIKSISYANAWLDMENLVNIETETSVRWLTLYSRLRPHSRDEEALQEWVKRHACADLRRQFGDGPWMNWLSTPIGVGGGGPCEWSVQEKWTATETWRDSKKIEGGLVVPFLVGLEKRRVYFAPVRAFYRYSRSDIERYRKEVTTYSLTKELTMTWRHNVSITASVYGFLNGEVSVSELSSRLTVPIPRGMRVCSRSRILEYIMLGDDKRGGLTSISHTRACVARFGRLAADVTRWFVSQKRYNAVRHIESMIYIYVDYLYRTRTAVFGTW